MCAFQVMSNVRLWTADCPWKGRGTCHVIHFRILHPLNFSAMAEDRIVKFCLRVFSQEILVVWWQTIPKHEWSRSRDVAIFWQISVNISKTVHEGYVQWKTKRKSYMAYQMAATAVTLNDLEGHPPVAGLFKCNLSNIFAAFYRISTDSVFAVPLC